MILPNGGSHGLRGRDACQKMDGVRHTFNGTDNISMMRLILYGSPLDAVLHLVNVQNGGILLLYGSFWALKN